MQVINIEQKFNERFQKLLQETELNFTPSPIWFERALLALGFASPMSLGVNGKEFAELLDAVVGNQKLNFYSFSLLSNNLEGRSARDLGIVLAEYANFMTLTQEYAEKWNEKAKIMREELMQELIGEEMVKNNSKVRTLKN